MVKRHIGSAFATTLVLVVLPVVTGAQDVAQKNLEVMTADGELDSDSAGRRTREHQGPREHVPSVTKRRGAADAELQAYFQYS